MPSIRVSIKHAGKTIRDLELDPEQPGAAFKQTIFEKTGVPLDRMKVMVKGGTLKDDTDWKKVGVKDVSELPRPNCNLRAFEPIMYDSGSDLHCHWCRWRIAKATIRCDCFPRRYACLFLTMFGGGYLADLPTIHRHGRSAISECSTLTLLTLIA